MCPREFFSYMDPSVRVLPRSGTARVVGQSIPSVLSDFMHPKMLMYNIVTANPCQRPWQPSSGPLTRKSHRQRWWSNNGWSNNATSPTNHEDTTRYIVLHATCTVHRTPWTPSLIPRSGSSAGHPTLIPRSGSSGCFNMPCLKTHVRAYLIGDTQSTRCSKHGLSYDL